jgi:hypothetical protein
MGIYGLAEELFAFQECICPMELVTCLKYNVDKEC